MKYTTLNNGIKMPMLGIGTYKMSDEETVCDAVKSALEIGYRHIDTAAYYHNEKFVGKAIKESSVAREDIFVTSKVWGTDIENDNVLQAFNNSIQLLDMDYIDLYLLHWPVKNKNVVAWKALEDIYASGRVKAIGVSNYLPHHLVELFERTSIIPVVNQIEMHPYLCQKEVVDFCQRNNVVAQSWSPLGSNKVPLLQDKILMDIAKKYSKSTAQIVLRWNIDRHIVVIPRSVNVLHQVDNYNIFDFKLSKDEVDAISKLNKNLRLGSHPDNINFL